MTTGRINQVCTLRHGTLRTERFQRSQSPHRSQHLHLRSQAHNLNDSNCVRSFLSKHATEGKVFRKASPYSIPHQKLGTRSQRFEMRTLLPQPEVQTLKEQRHSCETSLFSKPRVTSGSCNTCKAYLIHFPRLNSHVKTPRGNICVRSPPSFSQGIPPARVQAMKENQVQPSV